MELSQLFQLIQKTFSEAGLKLSPIMRNSMRQSYWVLNNELEIKPVSQTLSYNAYYGNCIEVSICPHNNGALEDTSYYLMISEASCNSFKLCKKIKIMKSLSEKVIVKRVNQFVDEYKQFLEDKKLANLVDKYLNI